MPAPRPPLPKRLNDSLPATDAVPLWPGGGHAQIAGWSFTVRFMVLSFLVKKKDAIDPALLQAVTATLAYGCTSSVAVFLNKIVITNYHFNFPFFYIATQVVCTFVILLISQCAGLFNPKPMGRSELWQLAPLSAIFFCQTLTGIASMAYLNLAMFVTLRRMNILFTMVAERVFLGHTHSYQVQLSVLLMVIGTTVAGLADLEYSTMGYVLMLLSNSFSALYAVLNISIGNAMKLNAVEVLYGQSITSMPLALLGTLFDLHSGVAQAPAFRSHFFVGLFLVSCAWIFVLNSSTLHCARVTSPLTTSIIGQTKNIITILASYYFWSTPFDLYNFTGISLSGLASLWYAYATVVEKTARLQ